MTLTSRFQLTLALPTDTVENNLRERESSSTFSFTNYIWSSLLRPISRDRESPILASDKNVGKLKKPVLRGLRQQGRLLSVAQQCQAPKKTAADYSRFPATILQAHNYRVTSFSNCAERMSKIQQSVSAWTVWKSSSMAFHGTDGFSFFDEQGKLVFRVDNYARKSKCDLVLMDGDGRALLTLRPQVEPKRSNPSHIKR